MSIAFLRTLSLQRTNAMNTAMKNTAAKLAVIPVTALALWGFSSLSAAARIVCNADGDCWHVHEEYAYPPAAGVIIHPDDWRWREGEHHVWREHPGRGYWRRGAWAPF